MADASTETPYPPAPLARLVVTLALAIAPGCGDTTALPSPRDATPDGRDDDSLGVDTAAPIAPTFADVTLGDTSAPVPPAAPDEPSDPRPAWLWPGEERPVAAYYPSASPAPGVRPPLLVLLHGFGASGAIQDAYLGVSREATARGWVVLTPDGTRNGVGRRFWNASPAWCCDFEGRDIDDLGYLSALIDHATERLGTDPHRVALIGHSNGGYMAHRLACAASDRIAAFASLAGGLPLAASDCAPTRPVPALHIHGTLDAVVLYLGQPGLYAGAETVVARWARYNRCATEGLVAAPDRLDLEASLPLAETTSLAAVGCEAPAELWRISGGSHVPAFRAAFMPEVLAWLEAAMPAPAQGTGGPR
jgi:polyhydroxybutyrate depolymerase